MPMSLRMWHEACRGIFVDGAPSGGATNGTAMYGLVVNPVSDTAVLATTSDPAHAQSWSLAPESLLVIPSGIVDESTSVQVLYGAQNACMH